VATAWDSGSRLASAAGDAISGGRWFPAAAAVLQIVVLAVPIAGIVLMLASAGRRGTAWVWTRTDGRPALRLMAGLAGAAGLTALLFAWIPPHNYQPIRPGERGTLPEANSAMRRLPAGSAPLPDHWPPAVAPATGPGGGGAPDASTTTTVTTAGGVSPEPGGSTTTSGTATASTAPATTATTAATTTTTTTAAGLATTSSTGPATTSTSTP
jgi:hypothetical protein